VADTIFYDDVDLYQKLDELKLRTASFFEARASSNNSLLHSLQAELARTKGKASKLLKERKMLLQRNEDMEEDNVVTTMF
jgi:hypothetical protein